MSILSRCSVCDHLSPLPKERVFYNCDGCSNYQSVNPISINRMFDKPNRGVIATIKHEAGTKQRKKKTQPGVGGLNIGVSILPTKQISTLEGLSIVCYYRDWMKWTVETHEWRLVYLNEVGLSGDQMKRLKLRYDALLIHKQRVDRRVQAMRGLLLKEE